MRLRITASAFNDRGPLYMEQALSALHESLRGRQDLTVGFLRDGPTVAMTCTMPDALRQLVSAQVLAHYPTANIERLAEVDYAACRWTATLSLADDLFPLKRHPQFADAASQSSADPLSGILSALSGAEEDTLSPRIEWTIRPATSARVRRTQQALRELQRKNFTNDPAKGRRYLRWALSGRMHLRALAWIYAHVAGGAQGPAEVATTTRTHDRETAVQAAADKLRRRLFEVELRLSVSGPADQEDRALAKLQELAGALGAFCEPEQASWRLLALRKSPGRTSRRTTFLLSTEELATLWHLPVFSIQVPRLDLALHRQLEPPVGLPGPNEAGTVVLGCTRFRDQHRRFGLRTEDRMRHLYVVGKTGMGKSTLLLNMLADDIAAGRGCCLVDPHGDLAEAVLCRIPPRRTNDVIVFDAGEPLYPVAFNPLVDCDAKRRSLVASGMLAAFKKLYGDSWGPRLEHIFRNCLLALLEVPGASLVSVLHLLSDAGYRRSVINRLHDPVVRAFWQQEFAGLPPKLQAEAVAPIQNKVGQFVSSPLLRHILGQARSTIDLRAIMDRGQVLIVNLSRGRVGEDASSLLGSLLISALQVAAMSRADADESERRDFHLYVDEFQHFSTDSFAAVLSEARKYRLALTLANQYLAQMEEATAAAVFGNVGSLVAFQVGADDAERLAAQFGEPLAPHDLQALPKHEAYARLLIDGLPSRPFSVRTLPPGATTEAQGEIIRRVSRRRYGRPQGVVAAEIEQGFAETR